MTSPGDSHHSRLDAAIGELAEAIRAEVRAAIDADASTTLPDRLLSIDEAATLLGGIARSTLYGEIGAGRLRTIKVGRRRLVPSSAITAYIEDRGRDR